MSRNRKLLIAGVAALALGAGGVGIAQAVGGDSDEQVTGPSADRAKRAAVEAAGGGRATAIERESEGRSAWEVEVVRPGGGEVEVELSSGLERVGVDAEDADDRDDRERGENDGEREDEEGAGDERGGEND